MIDSITKAGVTFVFYLFLMLTVFYILGGPIDLIFDGIIDNSAYDQVAQFGPNYKTAVRIAFAIGITTPVVWLVAKVFSREPAMFIRRKY